MMMLARSALGELSPPSSPVNSPRNSPIPGRAKRPKGEARPASPLRVGAVAPTKTRPPSHLSS